MLRREVTQRLQAHDAFQRHHLPIGDVGDGECGEFFHEHGDDGGIVDGPDGVLDAVGGG